MQSGTTPPLHLACVWEGDPYRSRMTTVKLGRASIRIHSVRKLLQSPGEHDTIDQAEKIYNESAEQHEEKTDMQEGAEDGDSKND